MLLKNENPYNINMTIKDDCSICDLCLTVYMPVSISVPEGYSIYRNKNIALLFRL